MGYGDALPGLLHLLEEDHPGYDIHAEEWETALVLLRAPELVDQTAQANISSGIDTIDFDIPTTGVATISPNPARLPPGFSLHPGLFGTSIRLFYRPPVRTQTSPTRRSSTISNTTATTAPIIVSTVTLGIPSEVLLRPILLRPERLRPNLKKSRIALLFDFLPHRL
jgi:hypothetical protein